MRGLLFRFQFVIVLAVLTTGYFASRAYQAKKALVGAREIASESREVNDTAVLALTSPSFPQGDLERLDDWRRKLDPQERRPAVAALHSALSARDLAGVHKAATDLIDQEARVGAQIRDHEFRYLDLIEHEIACALAATALGFLAVASMLRKRIFTPLEQLSRRMRDFLVDRYSFHFSRPEATELGDLQRTFNSLAQRVINTMDELKSLDQAKSEFLNIASHELRTPLTSIKGSLSLLDSGVMGHIDPSCVRLIKIAETETDRLIRLINNLLDLARIESGKLPLARAWLTWDDITAKTTEGLTGFAHKAGVHIKVDAAPGLEVFIDRDRIQQVLTNLLSNAIKYSPAGAWVHIGVGRSSHGELLVRIKDQGPGIDPVDRDLIFQKFRQGGSSTDQLVKGTGLGLAIAKALVAEHGGEIGFESELGRGSTFWFTLPEWRDDESSSDDPSQHGRSRAA